MSKPTLDRPLNRRLQQKEDRKKVVCKTDTHKIARLFSALGDETRLGLLTRLGVGPPQSIKQLTAEFPMTRQAVTKHLRILEDAELVAQETSGREQLYTSRPTGIAIAQAALGDITKQWDDALLRLKNYVVKSP
jgi:DNA-binding transcriptional ArsR family regulator